MQKFNLSDAFIDQYKSKKPDFGPLGQFVFLRTYSRVVDGENRNEQWWETCRRVVEGCFSIQKEHCNSLRLPWNNPKAQKSAQIMFNKIFSFKFLPSGRGLWMMGSKFVEERGNASPLLNCAFISSSDIETRGSFVFTWAMDALLLGVGVGFDTRGANKIMVKEPKKAEGLKFQIPDSREGWVESLELLLDAFFYGKKLPEFDYSIVRPYGSPIKGFGGVASGPEPLAEMHKNIKGLLEKKIGEHLKSVDIVDLMNMIAACVVAGNIRRSAELALGDAMDEEYITMKDSKSHFAELKTHRWASNNSIFAEVGKTDYKKFIDSIALNGEPGIVWLENIRKFGRMVDGIDNKDRFVLGLNPCGEIPLESGEMCNLVESFPSRHETLEEFKETLKYAYLYAKTVTLIPTQWPETNAVMMRNRRIGTSISGITDAFIKHGRRRMLEWCNEGYKYLRELDEIYSNWLCIPKSIKITTCKPSGSVSLLPGVSPGIHYPHSEYYIRRIRLASNSLLVKPLEKAGYHIETSTYGSNEEEKSKTLVVSFPIHEKFFNRRKEDVTIWEQVKNAVDLQRFWADNSVSITVTFKKEEKKQIVSILEAYEDSLKAISFLPLEQEGQYEQMPYEEITKEQYYEMIKYLKEPDFSSITTKAEGEVFCSNDACELPRK
jgi:ribonucleoside-triphosphate reductase (thioredoxin)